MTRRRWPVVSAAAPALAALALAGCTGVPTSSAPQTVESVRLGQQSPEQAIKPTPNASPRELVNEFLQANATDPASARLFLTPQAATGWRTETATIISSQTVSPYSPSTGTVIVSGNSFGTLNSAGIYKPALSGDGTGGEKQTFQFQLVKVNGQYRIDQLNPGLLLTDQEFADNYTQHSLYFYDSAHQYLVQDPRYSNIDDNVQLSIWLLGQLAAGMRPELQSAVGTNFPPGQTANYKITPGSPTRIEIPGAAQLAGAQRARLAAQLSQTLSDPLAGGSMMITDGQAPVTIPNVGRTFSPATFAAAAARPMPSPPSVYYLSGGRVYDQNGQRLPGPLDRGTSVLTSIAVSRSAGPGPPTIAAVDGSGPQRRLLAGNQSAGLRPTTLHGPLTRPSFAPGLREAWVGVGAGVDRVTIAGTTGRVSAVPVVQAPAGDQILALRISPDGVRVALVFGRPGQTSGRLFIGSLERGAAQARIDQLTQISPQLVSIRDVAWSNPIRLIAVGRGRYDDPSYFDTVVDGSDWTTHALGLSTEADSVTVTGGATPWVSAGGFVWELGPAQQWLPPTGGQTPGTKPVYAE